MKTTIIINDGYIDILEDGYNIIKKTVYSDDAIQQAKELLDLMEV